MDLLVSAREVRVGLLEVLERKRLVPTGREDVEGDLAADAVREAVVRELLLERLDKCRADLGLLVKLLKFLALLDARVREETYDALRPIGLTLTMPRRNSTKVPLR